MVKQQKTLDTLAVPWLTAFGHRLERARGQIGLTQAELAGSDLSKSFISLLETARSYPSVETLLLLARRAGTSPSALLMEAGDLRLDAALSLVALARTAVWTRPSWAERVCHFAEDLCPDMPLRVKAEVAFLRGIAATLENRLTHAEALARQAQALAGQAGFGPGKAHALALLGDVAILRREYAGAFTLLGRAVAQYRQSGALRSEPGIKALIWLGTAALGAGRDRYARRCYLRARTLAARLRLLVLEGQALWGLGYLARLDGDLAAAARLLQEARRSFEQSEDLINLSQVLMNLGAVYGEQGKLDQALVAVRQSIRIIDRLGNLRRRSNAHQDLAIIQLQRGEFDEAEDAARQALADASKVKDREHRARSLAVLGRIAAARKDRGKAVRHLRAAARQLKALGLKDAWAEVSRDLALVLKPGGSGAEAQQYLTQALNPEALLGLDGARGPATKRKTAAPRRAL